MTLEEIVTKRLSRRDAMKTVLSGATVAATLPLASGPIAKAAAGSPDPSTLTFVQAKREIDTDHQVAPGYEAQVLISWGDPVLAGAPPYDPKRLTAEGQERQFGYNNDFIGYLPLPVGSRSSDHGLLCVNHEYTNPELMFEGVERKTKTKVLTKDQCEVEMAAHGHTVIEVKRQGSQWHVVEGSPYARRISLRSTPMEVAGPVAGHPRLRTKADPTGRLVVGTLNNCAGGVTPWGTVLIAEENFNGYFGGNPKKTTEAENHKRYGLRGRSWSAWSRFFDRFDVEKEPHEPNRFGWMVEIDPYDPQSVPQKRTALGRLKHEAGTCALTKDGRVVVYMGDDERFQHIYRFISKGRVNLKKRTANKGLLDEGVLSVAQFHEDGTLNWLPLIYGQGELTKANGFSSQADVLIDTRKAAKLLGATEMDRPEDVQPSPVNGRIYAMLTKNTKRKAGNAANRRASNPFGHIVEIIPPGAEGPKGAQTADHSADKMAWTVFLQAGDPKNPDHGAKYNLATSEHGAWFAAPDNCCFDKMGRLWVSTDQGSKQRKRGLPDGMYATDVDGPGRALPKFFYGVPADAEMCGPCFTPDNSTLFVAVQHPAEGSTYAHPSTRWPDFNKGQPPRPSVVALTKKGGGAIGG